MAGFDAKECNRRNQIPTPTEGDLISREALKKVLCEEYEAREHYIGEIMLNAIDNAPTVPLPNEQIAREQGYEAGLARPKGEWTFDEKGYFYCDQCGKYPHDQYATTDFCPKCGADMRKGGAE